MELIAPRVYRIQLYLLFSLEFVAASVCFALFNEVIFAYVNGVGGCFKIIQNCIYMIEVLFFQFKAKTTPTFFGKIMGKMHLGFPARFT